MLLRVPQHYSCHCTAASKWHYKVLTNDMDFGLGLTLIASKTKYYNVNYNKEHFKLKLNWQIAKADFAKVILQCGLGKAVP